MLKYNIPHIEYVKIFIMMTHIHKFVYEISKIAKETTKFYE